MHRLRGAGGGGAGEGPRHPGAGSEPVRGRARRRGDCRRPRAHLGRGRHGEAGPGGHAAATPPHSAGRPTHPGAQQQQWAGWGRAVPLATSLPGPALTPLPRRCARRRAVFARWPSATRTLSSSPPRAPCGWLARTGRAGVWPSASPGARTHAHITCAAGAAGARRAVQRAALASLSPSRLRARRERRAAGCGRCLNGPALAPRGWASRRQARTRGRGRRPIRLRQEAGTGGVRLPVGRSLRGTPSPVERAHLRVGAPERIPLPAGRLEQAHLRAGAPERTHLQVGRLQRTHLQVGRLQRTHLQVGRSPKGIRSRAGSQ